MNLKLEIEQVLKTSTQRRRDEINRDVEAYRLLQVILNKSLEGEKFNYPVKLVDDWIEKEFKIEDLPQPRQSLEKIELVEAKDKMLALIGTHFPAGPARGITRHSKKRPIVYQILNVLFNTDISLKDVATPEEIELLKAEFEE